MPAADSSTILVDDLVVRFDEVVAVGGVSFAVRPGGSFGLLALYPLSIMPGWLHALARVNPLTYEVQGLRQMLLGVDGRGEVWLDFLVVVGFFVAMVAAATKAYPRAIL